MVSTPVQVHPLSTVSMAAKWEAHPLKRTRSALYPCLPNGKHTRSSAPAQHCTHACQMVSTPVQVHPLSTVSMAAKWEAHPLKRTRSALYPCLPNGKHTRSSAPAQHCIHGCQMGSTPAHAHLWFLISRRQDLRS